MKINLLKFRYSLILAVEEGQKVERLGIRLQGGGNKKFQFLKKNQLE